MFQINKWLYPGIRIKRWIFLFVLSVLVLIAGLSGLLGNIFKNVRIEAINIDKYILRLQRLKFADIAFMLLGFAGIILAIRRIYYSILTVVMPNKEEEFINIAHKRAKMKRGPRIAAIGGGTGMPNVLKGMKEYTSNLSAIVTVADDGGSSGRLRKDYQVLPPGDIRNCIVALSDEETLLGKLFQYRFQKGKDLAGHNFGNIFITALSNVVGDFSRAVKESSKVLAIFGEVLPVSLDNVTLKAKLTNGKMVKGESKITKAGGIIDRVYIEPSNCKPYQPAIDAIKHADIVVIGPGSLYTSVIPNLLVPGIKEALMNTKTLKIYISNIMTQNGETDNYRVSDHIKAIFKHTGGKIIDYCIANNGVPKEELLKRYAKEKAYLVKIDKEEINKLGVSLIAGKLFSEGDFIRHDPKILAKMVMKIVII